MQIGELSRRSGLSVDTLRYYEKVGLIEPPARDGGGRRGTMTRTSCAGSISSAG